MVVISDDVASHLNRIVAEATAMVTNALAT
jgi:hypothetical protein